MKRIDCDCRNYYCEHNPMPTEKECKGYFMSGKTRKIYDEITTPKQDKWEEVKVKYQKAREILKKLYKNAYNAGADDGEKESQDSEDYYTAYKEIEEIIKSQRAEVAREIRGEIDRLQCYTPYKDKELSVDVIKRDQAIEICNKYIDKQKTAPTAS